MPPSVKHFLGTLQYALGEERHFALLERCAESNQDSASNQLQVELDPTHASLRSTIAIMIASSNSPSKRGVGCPIDFSVFYCTPTPVPGWPTCGPKAFHCS